MITLVASNSTNHKFFFGAKQIQTFTQLDVLAGYLLSRPHVNIT